MSGKRMTVADVNSKVDAMGEQLSAILAAVGGGAAPVAAEPAQPAPAAPVAVPPVAPPAAEPARKVVDLGPGIMLRERVLNVQTGEWVQSDSRYAGQAFRDANGSLVFAQTKPDGTTYGTTKNRYGIGRAAKVDPTLALAIRDGSLDALLFGEAAS
jgi:hypothetical protein